MRIKNFIKETYPFYLIVNLSNYLRERNRLRKWEKAGRPVPPPHIYKILVVREYAKRLSIKNFIETGTYVGEMVNGVKYNFNRIYSIELDDNLFDKCQKYFRRLSHIKILHGDSSKLLPVLLDNISEPCLFWLDAHYSGGVTAKGEKETPIMSEIEYVLLHCIRNHCILIDDARCFIGLNDFPSIDEIKEIILIKRPDSFFEVKDDIIRITFN